MVLWNIFATNLKVLNPANTGPWKPRLLFQIWVEGPGCPEIWHLMLEQSLAFLSRHNSLAIQCSTECCSESSPLPMYCTNKQQQCTSNAPNCTTQCAHWALGTGHWAHWTLGSAQFKEMFASSELLISPTNLSPTLQYICVYFSFDQGVIYSLSLDE